MGNVTIGGNSYTIYGSQGEAIAYLAGSVSAAAIAFGVAVSDRQLAALVSAARVIDAEDYQGTPTVPGQLQAFPRTGVTRRDGTAVDPNATPIEINNGQYELAALLLAKPGLLDQNNADVNIQSVTAGPAGVTFFKPISAGRFPATVQRWLGQFFATPSIGGGSASTGTGAESSFDDCDRYGLVDVSGKI